MSEAVAEQVSKMSLGDTLYISEKRGDDTEGLGTAEKPFKTALRALRNTSAEPLPPLMVDAKEDGGEPYEPMAKSQLKKVTKLWKEDQRKREACRKKEEQDAKNREEQLEKAKQVVIAEDASLPAAELVARLNDATHLRGKRVKVQGWVQHLRRQGANMMFVEVRDGYGHLQCVLCDALCRTVAALTLNTEACVAVYGILQEVPHGKTAPGGHELQADYWELLANAPPGGLETQINKDSHPDVQLDKRHLLIRGENASKVLKLRSVLKESFVAHYSSRHYRWADPPAIVNAPCEGGSELFDVNYFGQKATLTQSSQLYLETCLSSMGKVYCMEKSFRAEPSKTRRHLAEYLHIEAEEAFISFEDLLDMLEDLVCDVVERVLADPEGGALVKALNPGFTPPKRPFKRMAYREAIEYLDQHDIRKPDGSKYEFGEDIPEMPERKMTDAIGCPILLHSFPAHIKAFYMQPHPTEEGLTESVDLLMPGVGEIVGGSMRMHDYDTLMEAFKKESLPTEPYQWYIDQRKFGTVPHGGYGLGLERFLCWLSDTHHIRDSCLYPRFVGRAYP